MVQPAAAYVDLAPPIAMMETSGGHRRLIGLIGGGCGQRTRAAESGGGDHLDMYRYTVPIPIPVRTVPEGFPHSRRYGGIWNLATTLPTLSGLLAQLVIGYRLVNNVKSKFQIPKLILKSIQLILKSIFSQLAACRGHHGIRQAT